MVIEFLCKKCADQIEYGEKIEAILEDDEYEVCEICSEEIQGKYFELESISLREDLVEKLQDGVHRCDSYGCGKIYDSIDKEDAVNFTNNNLTDMMSDILSDLPEDNAYHKLLNQLAYYGSIESIDFPEVHCGFCARQLDGWYEEVEEEYQIRTVPKIPELPPEIRKIGPSSSAPAHQIEYYRSDCSPYLIHMTRGNVVQTHVSSATEEPEFEELTAPQILWIILKTANIQAGKGKGMNHPAVCFTEKPLVALKDTLLGREAELRKSKALGWSMYGLMFPKEYLVTLGVQPVLPVSMEDQDRIPDELKHRVVIHAPKFNFLHEREWRAGADIKFDTKECIVLLPKFADIGPFQAALDREGIQVKGFLPLADLFACL